VAVKKAFLSNECRKVQYLKKYKENTLMISKEIFRNRRIDFYRLMLQSNV